jgi:hypothetical protein
MVICCVSLLYGVVYDISDWNCEVPSAACFVGWLSAIFHGSGVYSGSRFHLDY